MSQQGKDDESNGTAAGDKEGPGVSALQNNGGQGTDNSGGNAGDTSGDVTMTAAQMQTYMSRRKGAITKHLSALNRLIAERDINGLKSRLVNISKAFVAFEEIHEQYLATLDDANDIEACVKYFLHVDHDYSEGVNAANMWLEDYLHVDHDNRVTPPNDFWQQQCRLGNQPRGIMKCLGCCVFPKLTLMCLLVTLWIIKISLRFSKNL